MSENEKTFESIVFEATKKVFNAYKDAAQTNGAAIKCEDQFVGVIEITKSKICFIDNDISNISRAERQKYYSNLSLNTIAIVIESPHKKEYCKGSCLGPAMGISGKNLEKMLLGNLAKYILINDIQQEGAYFKTSSTIQEGKYKLLIINAVQYQCSLGDLRGEEKKQRRDKIFLTYFNISTEDFIKRLNKDNPKVIINCCTIGSSKNENNLQQQVQQAINRFNTSALKLMGNHPASAFFSSGFWDA